MNPKVSIIIVNWNGKHHLEKCLPSLIKTTYSSKEIIIVDNGSSDGSIEYVQAQYPEIILVRNNENKGFAGANNDALPYSTGKYILFLNNDTIVESNFIEPLVNELDQNETIGGVQSQIISMDDHSRYDSIGAFYTNTGFLYHYGYLQKVSEKYMHKIQLYTAKGACMMFRKGIIDEVGLFDPDFFAYFEETDFCHRVWLAGYSIVFIPDSKIYHKIGGTSNAMNNSFIQFHSFKNRINSYLKNLSILELVKLMPVHLLLCECAAFSFIVKGRFDLFLAINKSVWWNIVNISLTLQKRKKVQALRKVSDSQMFRTLQKHLPIKYYYHLFANSLETYNDQTIII